MAVITKEHGFVPDTRPPGYKTGVNWGPLGPSRLLLAVQNNGGMNWPLGIYGVPSLGLDPPATLPYEALWRGDNSVVLTCDIWMEIDDTDDQFTTFYVRLYQFGVPAWKQWRSNPTRRTWNYTSIVCFANWTGTAGTVVLRKVAEWVDMNKLPFNVTWLNGA